MVSLDLGCGQMRNPVDWFTCPGCSWYPGPQRLGPHMSVRQPGTQHWPAGSPKPRHACMIPGLLHVHVVTAVCELHACMPTHTGIPSQRGLVCHC